MKLKKNKKTECTVLGPIGLKVTAPHAGGHLGAAHGHNDPCQQLRGVRTPGAITVPATGTVAWREAAARQPTSDEVDGLSKRGSRAGRRARGGGREAYRAATRHEGGGGGLAR
jgi:hypothetical protein